MPLPGIRISSNTFLFTFVSVESALSHMYMYAIFGA